MLSGTIAFQFQGTSESARVSWQWAVLLFGVGLGLTLDNHAASANEGLKINSCFGMGQETERVEIVSVDRYGDLVLADGRVIGLADLEPLRLEHLARVKTPQPAHLLVSGAVDRWARTPAHVFLPAGGGWLQQTMLQSGMARVLPEFGPDACLKFLLAVEDHARKVTGRPSNPDGPPTPDEIYSVRDTAGLSNAGGMHVLAEGRVVSLGIGRRYRYLNFGYRWKTDFTVTINVKDEAAFGAFGHDVAGLAGAAVRVRGIVQERDGPWIHLDHPAQLEILARGPSKR